LRWAAIYELGGLDAGDWLMNSESPAGCDTASSFHSQTSGLEDVMKLSFVEGLGNNIKPTEVQHFCPQAFVRTA
jgi:hypothetical protein